MNDKVLLAVLKERQSAKGTRYLSGWLGKARLVAFLDREAPEGETVWQVFAQTPEERDEQKQGQAVSFRGSENSERRQPARRRQSGQPIQHASAGELDDPLPW